MSTDQMGIIRHNNMKYKLSTTVYTIHCRAYNKLTMNNSSHNYHGTETRVQTNVHVMPESTDKLTETLTDKLTD